MIRIYHNCLSDCSVLANVHHMSMSSQALHNSIDTCLINNKCTTPKLSWQSGLMVNDDLPVLPAAACC